MEEREYVEMGRFTSSVGLKGEMKVQLYNRDSSNFRDGARIYVGSGDGFREYDVERVRSHNGTCIAKLAGVDDRDRSDGLRNRTFSMASDDMEELPEGYHYISDLIGMTVYDVNSESEVGRVKDILTATAQEVYVVEREDGPDVMIPAVEAFVDTIDQEKGVITVRLIPGFLD